MTPRLKKQFLITAAIIITFIVASIYGTPLLNRTLPAANRGLALLLTPFTIGTLFSPLFSSTMWFFGSLAVALFMALVGLVSARPRRLLQLYVAAGATLLLLAPLLLPRLYGAYTLPVGAEDGYELFWATEPDGAFASAFKSAQRVHERVGCTYQLLGWSEDETLYFESECDGQLWWFDPAAQQLSKVTGLPAALNETDVERATAVGQARSYPSHPPGLPAEAINQAITYEMAVSPGGNWVAAAIMNYYGPRDVTVLSR